jgi:hypothetical protein
MVVFISDNSPMYTRLEFVYLSEAVFSVSTESPYGSGIVAGFTNSRGRQITVNTLPSRLFPKESSLHPQFEVA